MVKYALLIGINYLDSKYELPGCINDVYEFSDVLRNFKYRERNIIRITDLSIIKPEKDILYSKLEHISQSLKNKDYFLLYFSGHGKDEGIFTKDEKIIKIKDILNLFLNKPTIKIRIILDCCYKGPCFMRYCTSLSSRIKIFNINNVNTHLHEENKELDNDIFLLISSSDPEKSISGFIKTKKCEISVFTFYLLSILLNKNIQFRNYLYILKNITKKFIKINILQKPIIHYTNKNFLHNIIDI